VAGTQVLPAQLIHGEYYRGIYRDMGQGVSEVKVARWNAPERKFYIQMEGAEFCAPHTRRIPPYPEAFGYWFLHLFRVRRVSPILFDSEIH
jgi:hypothetical protein